MSTEKPLRAVDTKTTPGSATGGMGNGIFASTDIGTGENILHIQTPFAAVLNTPRLEDTCSGCFGRGQLGSPEDAAPSLRACTGCRVVRYCGKPCQAKDWKAAHSLECAVFQKLKPRVLPNDARAVLRMVLRAERGKYQARELELLGQLETHVGDMRERNSGQWERILLSSTAVRVYAGVEMEEAVISAFFAKFDLNSFNLTNALYDRVGLYLHPYAALINHSCEYNSVVGFDGDELYVTAIRPIKQGEQIFISYIDTTNPYNTRQKELAERYYFDCRCSKCMNGTNTPEDSFLSTPSDLASLEALEAQAHQAVQSAPAIDPTDAIQNLESAINSLHQTSIWPITRQPYIVLRDELITSLLSAGRFNAAFIHAAIRHTRIDPVVFPAESHPIRQIHAWTLAKLAIHLSQGVELNAADVSLQRFELNLGLVIWSVLNALVEGESRSCGVPGFKKLVRERFAEVHGQFVANGLDPRALGGEVRREWAKVEGVCREFLEKE